MAIYTVFHEESESAVRNLRKLQENQHLEKIKFSIKFPRTPYFSVEVETDRKRQKDRQRWRSWGPGLRTDRQDGGGGGCGRTDGRARCEQKLRKTKKNYETLGKTKKN